MHKTAYEMRISDCSSDVCSSDLRDHLPDGGLGFEPWAGRAAARVAGYRHVRENRTPRMPEEIVTPLLAVSLRYNTTFATYILGARAALDRLQAGRAPLPPPDRWPHGAGREWRDVVGGKEVA